MLYLFDQFELSEQEFSLSQGGKRVPLEPRALQVLLVLVGSQGRLLEKKALLDAVWKDTFVEETTLTRAIAVIRKSLEDDPRAPRYIETVPTRGYRFIAPVEIRRVTAPILPPDTAVSQVPPPEVSVAVVPGESAVPPSNATASLAEPLVPAKNYKRIIVAVVVAGIVAAVLGGLLAYRHHRALALSTKDTLVLGDFANNSGDPVFDEALRQGMLVQLEQSPVLRLTSDSQLHKTLKLMGLRPDARLTSEVSREVCQRLGGNVVLDGSIYRLGNEYVLGLRARRCSSGEELDAEQVQVARKEDALNALSQIATRFRTHVGEASATIKDLDTPLAEATTPSLEALKAFSLGIQNFNTKGSRAAVPLFQQATALDPQFAVAHAWLGRMHADLGEASAAVLSTQRAYELRERASDREQFSIDVSYDLLVTGNLEKARLSCDAWIQMYPRDVYPRVFLSGMVFPSYGQQTRALDEAKEAIAIDPDFVVGYRNAATNLIALDRPADAEQMLQQATQRKLFLPGFVTDAYRIAFLNGDEAGMKRAADSAPTNPWLIFYQAQTLARRGQLNQAHALQEKALDLSRHGSRLELEAELRSASALTDALYGYSDEAAKQARTALQLSSGKDVVYTAALVLAMSGHGDEAVRLTSDLQHRFPNDTLVRYNYVPTLQAAVALVQKHPQQAIDVLQTTAQFEPSLPLYPVYLRGQALLANRQPEKAAREFTKIVENPGLVLNDPLLNLAQINLAKSYLLAGEKDKARAAYDAVLLRWAGADSNLPILLSVRKARSEMDGG